MHTNQGCALRKTEGSPVLWACKIQGVQHMICMKKLWFSSRPRTKVRHQGPLGSARAHPYGGEKILAWSKPDEWLGKGKGGWSLAAYNAAKWDSAVMLLSVKCLSIDRFTVLLSKFSVHLVASGDSLFACSPVTHGAISSTPCLNLTLLKVTLVGGMRVADRFCLWELRHQPNI